MVSIYMKNDILSLKRNGMSNRKIALELNISKDTVNKYVKEMNKLTKLIENETDKQQIIKLQKELVSAPIRKGVSVRKIFSGNLKQRFYELLKQDEDKDLILGLNKQKVTASLLHRKLRSEGFNVGITTIQIEYKRYKNRNKETFIKQKYEPGFRAEYDFHEIKVIIDGKLKKVHQATVTLPYSNYIFVKHYENQKFETFIDSLVHFFEEIGGVPKQIVFDNMRNVVSRFVYGGSKIYNEELIKLSNYYGFKIMTTNPRSGNEKGHVENSGKIARTELFTFSYKFNSLKSLRDYVFGEINKLNQDKIKLINEKTQLINLPKTRYELGRLEQSKVNHESIIMIESNYYSVPDSYVGKSVYSNVYIGHINVYNLKHELIASHKKIEGNKEHSINILHYTSTLLKKPGALTNSLALKQSPKIYQELFHKYFTTNPKDFIKLISENDIYELNELLVKLNNGKNIKCSKTNEISIEEVSSNQLTQISNLFNQGENIQ
ncbi:IS21 family transposase [Haploplasma axanthum]|nr:IS21 family transposase [Haploplasma axanthum]